jgi:Isochorismatase family
VCVLQSALSLINPPYPLKPYIPYIVADGISSCNQFEVPIAIDRLRQEGAVITTSESLAFQLIGSANHPQFKAFSQLVREQKDLTTRAGEALLQRKDAAESTKL